MIKELITKNRSYRRFKSSRIILRNELEDMVDCARLSASGANMQSLKYFLSCDTETNNKIFPYLAWAGYLVNWTGPVEDERPTGYIIILGDTTINKNFGCDHGIAAQSIMLAATEKKLGGCIIASIRKDELKKVLNLPEHLEILLVLALGETAEEVIIEDVNQVHGIKYWRDEDGKHHVPKRKLNDLIIN